MGFLNSLKDIFSLPDYNEIEKQNRFEAQNNIENTKWIEINIATEAKIELVPFVEKVFNKINQELKWKKIVKPCQNELTWLEVTLTHPKGPIVSPAQIAEDIDFIRKVGFIAATELGMIKMDLQFINKDFYLAPRELEALILGPWQEGKNTPQNLRVYPSSYALQIRFGLVGISADISNILKLETENIELSKKIFGSTLKEIVKIFEKRKTEQIIDTWLKGVKQLIREKE